MALLLKWEQKIEWRSVLKCSENPKLKSVYQATSCHLFWLPGATYPEPQLHTYCPYSDSVVYPLRCILSFFKGLQKKKNIYPYYALAFPDQLNSTCTFLKRLKMDIRNGIMLHCLIGNVKKETKQPVQICSFTDNKN